MRARRWPLRVDPGDVSQVWFQDPADDSWHALGSVGSSEEAVDLEFIRGLPADNVSDLSLTGDILPASFAAVAHLVPGLRRLGLYLDNLGDDAPSVIVDLTALESLPHLGQSGVYLITV